MSDERDQFPPEKPEDTSGPDSNKSDDPDALSTIFVEMMRQAAEKRARQETRNPFQSPPKTYQALPDDVPPPPTSETSEADVEISPAKPPTRPTRPLEPPPVTSDSVLEPVAEISEAIPIVKEARPDDEAALQKRRRQKREEKKNQRSLTFLSGFFRTVIIILIASGLTATIFTWFTDPAFFRRDVVIGLQVADATSLATIQPTALPSTPNWFKRIGIVSGHRGPEGDPGAVCPDGITEAEINFNVATRVVENLRALSYTVDLLDEFDPRLDDYRAAALISIHSNTCQDFGEVVSGFLVAKAAARPTGGSDDVLAECLARYYGEATQKERRLGLTIDMTDYHTFREIHRTTSAAIIELGFMLADRELLTQQPDLMARAITNGVICFLEPNSQATPIPETPSPETSPEVSPEGSEDNG